MCATRTLQATRIAQRQYERIVKELEFAAWTEPVVFEAIPVDLFGPHHEFESAGLKLIQYASSAGEYWPGDFEIGPDTPIFDPSKDSATLAEALFHQMQIDMDGEYFVLPVPVSWVKSGRLR